MDLTKPTTISIDESKCKKDGLCARVCPARIFSFAKGAVPAVTRAAECALCGQCLSVCASNAINHSQLDAAGLRKISNPLPVGAEDMLAFLRQRRSVRAYRKGDIPDRLLEEIAATAGYAPVGAFGAAGWIRTVTIVSGEEKMKAVREATIGYLRKLKALLSGFMMKTVSRFSDEAKSGMAALPDLEMRLAEWEAGRDAILYDAPAAIFVSTGYDTSTPHEDCDGALMTMMFAAHAHGLGTCWNGYLGHAALANHVSGPRELGDLIGIPEKHTVVEAFTIGWPLIPLHSVPRRETSIRIVK
jgi:nitroreductase/NAD-dependent dihydropyrimidine dehydrogenase PreA subunit